MKTEKVVNYYEVKNLSRLAFSVGVGICIVGFIQLCIHCLLTANVKPIVYLPLVGAVLSGFAAAVFITLWNRVQRNYRNDLALVSLAGAMIVWGIMGLDWYWEGLNFIKSEYSDIASSVNNYFLLTALFFFEHGGPNYRSVYLRIFGITKDNYLRRVFSGSLFIVILIFVLETVKWDSTDELATLIDLAFSMLVGVGLIRGLWMSFNKRALGRLGYFSTVTIGLAMLAQLLSSLIDLCNSTDFDFRGVDYSWMKMFLEDNWVLLKIVILLLYKILLIFIFGALATSWLFSKRMENVVFQRQDMLHMVRNSIDSLIFEYRRLLKASEFKDNKKHSDFYKENISRVVALRELYELLYNEKSIELKGSVNLHEYLSSLIDNLRTIYAPSTFKRAIHLGGLPSVRADSTVDLGKIIVETATNSFKHGDGVVSIKCEYNKVKGELVVRIVDRGSYNEDVVNQGFGLKAINLYLKNLQGDKIINHLKNGTEFKYVFSTLEKFKYYDRTNFGG